MSGKRVHATFSVMWEKTILTKQTLFPVWGDKEDRKARKGSPPDTEYTLRATKGVNMHPFPILRLDKEDGSSYTEEEMIRLSLVCATDKLPPPVGSCTCGGVPILTESKPLQLHIDHGETITKIRGGVLEFTKLQIGCCTGQRGHNCALCIKAEFVGEKSLLKGLVVYSLPIEVGAKGPFAKIFTKGQAVEEEAPAEVVEDRVMDAIVPINTAIPTPSYEGAEEMVALLKKLNLHKYIHLFAAQEVDIQAFLQLTDSDLNEIGITKVGPRVKILKEIARIKEGRTLPLPVPSLQLLPPTPVPALPQLPAQSEDSSQTPLIPIPRTPSLSRMPSLPSFSFDSSSLSSPMLASFFQDETSEPTSKRRKTLEGFPSSGSFIENEDKGVSIYIYLSNIVASNNILKKTLFMVKSEKNKWETEQIVQQIQHQVVSDLSQKGKYVFHEGKAQVMLILQPGKNGIEWQAKSAHSEQIWNFKKGDYIKIDNHHNVDISINVHYYYIPSASKTTSDKLFVEDFRSPKKYPTLFPGGSLEIGIDENRDGRLALAAELDFEPSETFAVTKNGKLIPVTNEPSTLNETCNFSFKRRKDSMKKAESFDDFQKEIFLSKVLDPAML